MDNVERAMINVRYINGYKESLNLSKNGKKQKKQNWTKIARSYRRFDRRFSVSDR